MDAPEHVTTGARREPGRVPPTARLSRRTVLAGSGAGAATALLAACGGDRPAGTRQGDAASSGRGGGGTADVEPGQVLAEVDDVPVGGALAVTVGGAPLLVTQPQDGAFAAFSAVCTHAGCTVGPGDGELLCPCHQSRYDLATGAVLGGPAPGPLAGVRVEVDGGRFTSA